MFGKLFVIDDIARTNEVWYVYLVRTEHNKLYCGSSNDPVARFYKHCHGKGAKFFASSKPVALVYIEQCGSKSHALKREYEIKKLTKYNKEQLIVNAKKEYQLPILYNKDILLTLAEVIL